jgi:oligopeptide/dipeptide ABC transporter ATP-binding protein
MGAVLEVENISRWYPSGGWKRGGKEYVKAVIDVSFTVGERETVGLIGESGCGKSTLGRTVIGLEELHAGTVRLSGEVISGLGDRKLRTLRRGMQMVWQNPASAVNPRKRIDRIIGEPLDIHGVGTSDERRRRVSELIELVGLRPEMGGRYPHELSGGQLQRVVTARALALEPKLLVCDEPTSALDISVRAQIVNLLVDIRDKLGLAMLYISHDLRTVSVVSDRILIMYLGRVVEEAPAAALDTNGLLHPYARALIAAAPTPDPTIRRGRPPAMGEVPSAVDLPSGCSYHPRCQLAKDICRRVRPELVAGDGNHRVACHAVSGPAHAQWLGDEALKQADQATPAVQLEGGA